MFCPRKKIGFRRLLVVAAFIVLLLGLQPTAVFGNGTEPLNKISGFLQLASNLSKVEGKLAGLSDIIEIYQDGEEPAVGVVIKTFGPLWELREMGITLRSTHGNVATATVPLSALENIATLASVVSVEPSMVHYALHDRSVPDTRADEVHTGTPPFTGRGVIVGIIDTGINVNHDDFKDESGKTRILYLWDQLVDQPDVAIDPPVGYEIGIEYTADEIDAGECPHVDTGGHGTHVSGSAAGDGSSTGGKYRGMAYEADIIFVDSFAPQGGTNSTFYLDGIDYIMRKAQSLGKPYVINMSLGGNSGPHDGSTASEQAINNDVDSGATIVIAAGNEGSDKLHAVGRVIAGSSLDFEFTVPSDMTRVGIDIWYEGEDALQFSIYGPTSQITAIPPENGNLEGSTSDADFYIERAHPSELNGDNQFLVYLTPPTGASAIATGDWKLRFEPYGGDPLAGGGQVHAWIYAGSGYAIWSDADDEDPNITLGSPGTAEQAITVGAYVTKVSWKSKVGIFSYPSFVLSDLAPFSSRGPTRTGAFVKPEIAAPGAAIASVYAPESNEDDNKILDENPPDQHQIMVGTSMAAPHVCGGVALMLQKNPDLTPRQIKEALINSARTDTFTGDVPNEKFGYGKLDIKAAIDRVSLPEGSDPYGSITLVSVTSQIDADGSSATSVVSEVITDASGNTIPDGYKFVVSIVYGSLSIKDLAAETTVQEMELISSDGVISFEIQAGNIPGDAKLEAESKKGNAYGKLDITLTTLGSQTQGSETGPKGVRSCFVATAVFAHPLASEVLYLKRFRDRFLITNTPGRAFVFLYYHYLGPVTANFIERHPLAKYTVRRALVPMVAYARWSLESGEFEQWLLTALLLSLLGFRYLRRRPLTNEGDPSPFEKAMLI